MTDSLKDTHCCKFALIQCIDFRFRAATEEFATKLFGTPDFDLYSWPGAAKKLADDATREAALADIRVCAELHHGEKLVIVSHMDCGAYGGSKAFSDIEEEIKKMTADLHKARDIVREAHPTLEVETYLLNPRDGYSFDKV